MMIKPSQFREDIYNLLDKVIKTGVTLEIKRKGKVLKVVIDKESSKLINLKKRDVAACFIVSRGQSAGSFKFMLRYLP